MPKSKSYSSISGLEGNAYVFSFQDTDLVGIFKDGSILDPNLEEWTKAKDSDEALSAYNIFKNGTATEA